MGKAGTVHISYYDPISLRMRHAWKNLSGWSTETVDGTPMAGSLSALAADQNDVVHLVYVDLLNNLLIHATNGDISRPTGYISFNQTRTNTQTVTANITCSDSGTGCSQMRFCVSTDYIYYQCSAWQAAMPFAPTASVSLPYENQANLVFVQVRDAAGNWSQPTWVEVDYDVIPPAGSMSIAGGASHTAEQAIMLNLAYTENMPGNAYYETSTNGSSWTSGTYVDSGTQVSYLLPAGEGTKTVYVRYVDLAGNASSAYSSTIYLDNVKPVTTASVPGGTKSGVVPVTLTCSDGSGIGCEATYYSLDGSTPTVASTLYTGGTITISGTQTPTYLKYYSVDKLGNAENVKMQQYDFVSGYSSLTLDLSSPTLLQNGQLSASGKLTRYPNTEQVPNNDMDLSGLPVDLTITGPAGSSCQSGCVVHTTTYSSLGHYEFKNLSYFEYKGLYGLKARFAGTGLHQASESSTESVMVGSSAGYAILIEGKIGTDEGLGSHNKTANRIYETLKDRGFEDDNIFYFNYAGTMIPGVDSMPVKTGTDADHRASSGPSRRGPRSG